MNCQPNHITAAILFAALIAVGIYDLAAQSMYGYDATVTAVIQQWIREYPMLIFVAGYVAGHLFWPPHSGKGLP
jgi:hypothetical protein